MMDSSKEKTAFETKQEPILRDPRVRLGTISDDEREVFKRTVDGTYVRTYPLTSIV